MRFLCVPLSRTPPPPSSVAEVLTNLRLEEYADNFAYHHIEHVSDLRFLTENQLATTLGVSKTRHRRRLQRWIAKHAFEEHDSNPHTIHQVPLAMGEREVSSLTFPTERPHLPLISLAEEPDVSTLDQEVSTLTYTYEDPYPTDALNHRHISVWGAGVAAVNGTYTRCGLCDGVGMFRKPGKWKGKKKQFVLFRFCLERQHYWFISIVPHGMLPGSRRDVDFYSAPAHAASVVPPQHSWGLCARGVLPAPRVVWGSPPGEEEEEASDYSSVDAVESLESYALEHSPQPREERIVVKHAGTQAVNGVYEWTGHYSNGEKTFGKQGRWNGEIVTFSLFRCLTRGDQIRWYISIVPDQVQPGTTLDIDFYSARAHEHDGHAPPSLGWVCVEEGIEPVPEIVLVHALAEPRAETSSSAWEVASTASSTMVGMGISNQDKRVCVERAGDEFINGVYLPAGELDGATMYTKKAIWRGRERLVSLFRCRVQGNTKRWYISIVPDNQSPGTTYDVDFYTAPAFEDDDLDFPPVEGWIPVDNGRPDPPHVLTWIRVPTRAAPPELTNEWTQQQDLRRHSGGHGDVLSLGPSRRRLENSYQSGSPPSGWSTSGHYVLVK